MKGVGSVQEKNSFLPRGSLLGIWIQQISDTNNLNKKMLICVPTHFEGREFDKLLKLLNSTPKMGQFWGHFCLQSENES